MSEPSAKPRRVKRGGSEHEKAPVSESRTDESPEWVAAQIFATADTEMLEAFGLRQEPVGLNEFQLKLGVTDESFGDQAPNLFWLYDGRRGSSPQRFEDETTAARASIEMIDDLMDDDRRVEFNEALNAKRIRAPGGQFVEQNVQGQVKFAQALARSFWPPALLKAVVHNSDDFMGRR